MEFLKSFIMGNDNNQDSNNNNPEDEENNIPEEDDDEQPKQESNQEEEEEQVETLTYSKGLKRYFKLKNKYKNSTGKGNRKRCVGCKRKVGTTFSFEEGKYVATCGNANDPCPLDIQIRREIYGSKKEQLKSLKEKESKIKYDIIDLKLRFLFRMINETDMVDIFSTLKDDFNNTFKEIEEIEKQKLREKETTIENDEILKEAYTSLDNAIKEIKSSMREFQETQDTQHIEDAVTEYTDELLPTLRMIQKMKNIRYKMTKGFFYIEKKEPYYQYLVRQHKNHINNDPDEYVKVEGEVIVFKKK